MLNLETKKIINSRHEIGFEKNFKIWSEVNMLHEKEDIDDNHNNLKSKAEELKHVNHDVEINQQPELSERTKD
jgi:hypothetical protein